jgi:hypothetical protein
MATQQEKALCVGWFFETKSAKQVPRNLHTHFAMTPQTRNSITTWQRKFLKTELS